MLHIIVEFTLSIDDLVYDSFAKEAVEPYEFGHFLRALQLEIGLEILVLEHQVEGRTLCSLWVKSLNDLLNGLAQLRGQFDFQNEPETPEEDGHDSFFVFEGFDGLVEAVVGSQRDFDLVSLIMRDLAET